MSSKINSAKLTNPVKSVGNLVVYVGKCQNSMNTEVMQATIMSLFIQKINGYVLKRSDTSRPF